MSSWKRADEVRSQDGDSGNKNKAARRKGSSESVPAGATSLRGDTRGRHVALCVFTRTIPLSPVSSARFLAGNFANENEKTDFSRVPRALSQPSSAGRRASRVADCKLLRTRGWFTANWFVNVAFTSPGTPVCLPCSLSKINAPVSPSR